MVLFQFSEKKSKNKVFSILVIEVLVICIIQAPSILGVAQSTSREKVLLTLV